VKPLESVAVSIIQQVQLSGEEAKCLIVACLESAIAGAKASRASAGEQYKDPETDADLRVRVLEAVTLAAGSDLDAAAAAVGLRRKSLRG
jgi:hypothetical protein